MVLIKMKVNLKTHRKTEANKVLEKILNKLCHLEDLNSYRINRIGKCISLLEDINFIQE